MIERVKTYLIVGLGVFIGTLLFYQKHLEHQRDQFLGEKEFKDGQLQKMVTIHDGLVQELGRVHGKMRVINHFIPPEGSTTFKQKQDGTVLLSYDSAGFTFRPGVGAYYRDGAVRTAVSCKVAYLGRYGLVLNGNKEGIGVGMSRYLGDLIPYWSPKNLEGWLDYEVVEFYSRSGTRLRLGIRITL